MIHHKFIIPMFCDFLYDAEEIQMRLRVIVEKDYLSSGGGSSF